MPPGEGYYRSRIPCPEDERVARVVRAFSESSPAARPSSARPSTASAPGCCSSSASAWPRWPCGMESAQPIVQGLIAASLAQEGDPREALAVPALHRRSAEILGLDTVRLFDEAAGPHRPLGRPLAARRARRRGQPRGRRLRRGRRRRGLPLRARRRPPASPSLLNLRARRVGSRHVLLAARPDGVVRAEALPAQQVRHDLRAEVAARRRDGGGRRGRRASRCCALAPTSLSAHGRHPARLPGWRAEMAESSSSALPGDVEWLPGPGGTGSCASTRRGRAAGADPAARRRGRAADRSPPPRPNTTIPRRAGLERRLAAVARRHPSRPAAPARPARRGDRARERRAALRGPAGAARRRTLRARTPGARGPRATPRQRRARRARTPAANAAGGDRAHGTIAAVPATGRRTRTPPQTPASVLGRRAPRRAWRRARTADLRRELAEAAAAIARARDGERSARDAVLDRARRRPRRPSCLTRRSRGGRLDARRRHRRARGERAHTPSRAGASARSPTRSRPPARSSPRARRRAEATRRELEAARADSPPAEAPAEPPKPSATATPARSPRRALPRETERARAAGARRVNAGRERCRRATGAAEAARLRRAHALDR